MKKRVRRVGDNRSLGQKFVNKEHEQFYGQITVFFLKWYSFKF